MTARSSRHRQRVPSLDPAMKALARVDPEMRMSRSTGADDILSVARCRCDPGHLCQAAAELLAQLTRCKAIGRFGLGSTISMCRPLRRAASSSPTCRTIAYRKSPTTRWRCSWRLPARCRSRTSWCRRGVGRCQRWRRCAASKAGCWAHWLRQHPRALAPKAKAFGLKVVAYDPYAAKELFASTGVESVSFDDLLARSDFISVHAPLLPATRGLVNARPSPR